MGVSLFIRISNPMIRRLEEYSERLEGLVQGRMAELEQNYKIQAVLNSLLHLALEESPLDKLLDQALDIILSFPMFAFESKGCVFFVKDEPRILVVQAQKGLPESCKKDCASVPFGRCICGRAALSGSIEFVDCIDDRHEILYEGITPHGHYCVPIIADEMILGVMCLFLKEGHSRAQKEEEFLSAAADTLAGIIKRKQAEEALKESEQYTRGLIESSLDLLVTLSTEGRIIDVNRATELVVGLSRDEIIGTDFRTYFTDPAEAERGFEKVFAEGHLRDYPLEVRSADGKIIPVLCNGSVLKDSEGRLTGVFASARDMTELYRAGREKMRLEAEVQAAEMANLAKSQFLAGMSHELRTPLNAIIGFSEVLRDQYFGKLNEKQVEYATDILDSGKHLLSLINEILDLSKIEAGGLELELSRVSIKDLLGDSMIMIREKAMKHGIGLDILMPEELTDLEITADARKLKQIMVNLLSNAAKFTPDGGAIKVEANRVTGSELRVSGLEQDATRNSQLATGDFIEISVSDTGIGISHVDQEHVFDEFYQVKDGTRDKTPGTGLGLALCKRLVEMHGGKIWVESEGEGKGSRFSFILPVRSLPPDEDICAAVGVETGIESEQVFLNRLEEVLHLSRRHKRPLILARFHVRLERVKEKDPGVEEVLKQETRTCDFWGTDQEGYLYLVFQETDERGAEIVCRRFVEMLERETGEEKISFSWAIFPEDGESAKELLEKVRAGKAA
ncbi:MAG: PAS domain S-box protein [Deltaproteobacteria bacterium]|nr:PAS domain S-box protein [Deltaproteobacteria bacterium]